MAFWIEKFSSECWPHGIYIMVRKNADKVAPKTYLSQPVEIIASDIGLRRSGFEVGEFVHLLIEDLANLFRHLELGSTLFEFLNELVLAIALHPELLLNPLKLFHEVVLSLTLLDLALHIPRDLALQLSVDEFLLQDEEGLLKSFLDDHAFQHVLELSHFARGYGSSKVGELVGFVEDVGRRLGDCEVGDLVPEQRVELSNVLEY